MTKNKENFANIEGKLISLKENTAPKSGRRFREAWMPPKDGVIQIDMDKAINIAQQKRINWAQALMLSDFKYKSDTFKMNEEIIDGVPEFISASGKIHTVNDAFIEGFNAAKNKHKIAMQAKNVEMSKKIAAAKNENNFDKLEKLVDEMNEIIEV
jgi:hypothetical protein